MKLKIIRKSKNNEKIEKNTGEMSSTVKTEFVAVTNGHNYFENVLFNTVLFSL